MCHRYFLEGFHRDSSSKGFSMFSWLMRKKMCVFEGRGGGNFSQKNDFENKKIIVLVINNHLNQLNDSKRPSLQILNVIHKICFLEEVKQYLRIIMKYCPR